MKLHSTTLQCEWFETLRVLEIEYNFQTCVVWKIIFSNTVKDLVLVKLVKFLQPISVSSLKLVKLLKSTNLVIENPWYNNF